ncbi:MAG TPA: sialate O-acetylesterase [Candidatus Acidoferrales bacterium]|jgi:sialate O-acetylesterase|nr:sialate O-acetylesterase [Candidatus Acidoferrales bacterium]
MKPSFIRPAQRFTRLALLLFLGCLWTVSVAHAEIRLPHIFGSHMVFQQDKPLTIWGWAKPDEEIKVQLGETTKSTRANDRGEWKVVLPAMKASGPYQFTVSGSSTVAFDDVMIGEVWLCSGQSNMELGLGLANNAKEEIAAANHPGIRLLMVENRWTPLPQDDMEGTWKVCTPETVAQGGWQGFSATAYFFGRELNEKLGVTVGLVDADWGGTRIESWTPPEGFAAVPALKSEYEKIQLGDPHSPLHQKQLAATLDKVEQWDQAARKALVAQEIVPPQPGYPDELLPPHDLQQATALYNGMIHPLKPFPIRGAIWYQGEANVGEGMRYAERMNALVTGWREVWNKSDFPFYFVQLAPFNYGGDPQREAEIWEAQTVAARTIPDTGMAVINDVGNLADIHPRDKQSVGHRLALLALARTYGYKDLVDSGPTFKDLVVTGDSLRVNFDHADGGLAGRDGKSLDWFEIIDAEEGGFVKADARIDGASVVLSASGVKHPVAMRFAWSGLATPNLMNAAGLPAGAFRAGDLPKRDWLAKNVPEAKDYRLIYDLDLTKLGSSIKYDVDNHLKINQPFDRIAYCVELQDADFNTKGVYVSMDAFTADPGKIGIPVFGSGADFQQNLTNLDIYSNVKGIETGTGLAGGNIEFWPNNYDKPNAAGVPNASGDVFDFGDQRTWPVDGYGSMQIHNHDARQTLFAINHWSAGAHADVGIGNQPKDNPDWTFAANADGYRAMRLRVLVHCR